MAAFTRLYTALLLATVTLVAATPAYAYIGPGAGLGAFIVVGALVFGVVLLVIGMVWFPLKRRRNRNKAAAAKPSPDSDSSPK